CHRTRDGHPGRRIAHLHLSRRRGSRRPDPAGGRPLRGLRPAVHPPALPGDSPAGSRSTPLPLPQRKLRSRDGTGIERTTRAATPPRHPGGPGRGDLCDRRGGAPLMTRSSRFARSQRGTIVNGILSVVLVLVILQLWLLIATMNAYLG